MTGVIEWSDPPEKNRGGRTTRYAEVIADLEANPGEWGVVAHAKANGIYVALRKAYGPEWGAKFEIQSAEASDGTWTTWARRIDRPFTPRNRTPKEAAPEADTPDGLPENEPLQVATPEELAAFGQS